MPLAELKQKIEVKRCGCKSPWCDRCSIGWGLSIRSRLRPAVKRSFASKRPVMATLTVDRANFKTPQEATDFVHKKSLVSRFVKDLYDRGFIKSRNYFAVLEWHMKTDRSGWPHWHIVLDSNYIEHEELSKAWQRLAKQGAVNPDNPMGFVWISKKKAKTLDHAINYMSKYLIKPPKEGWPDWLLNSTKKFKRYLSSHRFFKGLDRKGEPEFLADKPLPDEKKKIHKRGSYTSTKLTIAERLSRCGCETVLLAVTESVFLDGQERTQRKFLGRVSMPIGELSAILGYDPEAIELEIDHIDLKVVQQFFDLTKKEKNLQNELAKANEHNRNLRLRRDRSQSELFENDYSTQRNGQGQKYENGY